MHTHMLVRWSDTHQSLQLIDTSDSPNRLAILRTTWERLSPAPYSIVPLAEWPWPLPRHVHDFLEDSGRELVNALYGLRDAVRDARETAEQVFDEVLQ